MTQPPYFQDLAQVESLQLFFDRQTPSFSSSLSALSQNTSFYLFYTFNASAIKSPSKSGIRKKPALRRKCNKYSVPSLRFTEWGSLVP